MTSYWDGTPGIHSSAINTTSYWMGIEVEYGSGNLLGGPLVLILKVPGYPSNADLDFLITLWHSRVVYSEVVARVQNMASGPRF